MSNIPIEEIDTLVKNFFGFLIDEYKFILKKSNDLAYDFESPTTKVSVFIEYNTLVVGIEPIGEESRKLLRNNILSKRLDVIVVAKCLNPDLDYKVVWDEPISSAMDKKSKIVKKYCRDFLIGDFTKWTDVLAALNKRK